MEKFKLKLKNPTISLLTDFGTRDHFVGTMKGVILSICPEAKIVDVTHEVSAFNIMEAAFILKNSYNYFPEGTVHLVVVDPGVGSEREILIVKSRKYIFVAPDNGVLSDILKGEENVSVYKLDKGKFSIKNASSTFHGRDILAPLAARLAKGELPSGFGKKTSNYKIINIPEPVRTKNIIKGEIIYTDSFGNLITNIRREYFKTIAVGKEKFEIRCKEHRASKIASSYSEGNKKDVNCIWASHGNLEIFVREGNASKKLKIKAGDKVTISFIRN